MEFYGTGNPWTVPLFEYMEAISVPGLLLLLHGWAEETPEYMPHFPWEISPADVTWKQELGRGFFGVVYEGTAFLVSGLSQREFFFLLNATNHTHQVSGEGGPVRLKQRLAISFSMERIHRPTGNG